jgi:hypothetical protein
MYRLSVPPHLKWIVHMAMQPLTFNGEMVVMPLLVYMHQSPLPLTKSKVLNARKHQQVVVVITSAKS